MRCSCGRDFTPRTPTHVVCSLWCLPIRRLAERRGKHRPHSAKSLANLVSLIPKSVRRAAPVRVESSYADAAR